MKRPELLARILIAIGALSIVGVPVWLWSRTPILHARMAENGGWSPDILQAQVGVPLHLQLTSDDVTHGFAVGQMDLPSVDIEPGKVTDVTLTFEKPGTYTFYCTRWCGINHWRMRGTIEVEGPTPPSQDTTPPLYVILGLDLDAPHDSPIVPDRQPSAQDGQKLSAGLTLSEFSSVDFYRTHSPYEAWKGLRTNPSLSSLNDQQIWDLIAFLWQSQTTPEAITEGRRLYAQNCAACHGEAGGGDGLFAGQLAAAQTPASTMNSTAGMSTKRPADFTDAKRMLGASPALLEGKILRGGMGTGMPSWGPILTEEQVWKIVGYLYTFPFQEFTK